VMLITGTIPIRDLPLVTGGVKREGDSLVIDGYRIPCAQGTGAMISAALVTTDYLKLASPQVVVAGDIGEGGGSRQIYEYLIQNVARLAPRVLVLHYCLPDMALMRRLCQAVGECHPRPLLIADAGSMYAAKAAGLAREFDVFTPDAAELAFLADTEATHPAYISRHLFCGITRAPRLIVAAYRQRSAARLLLVKGATDYIARDGEILATVTEPDVPELEAIGGTGDTITGLLSAFVSGGLEPHEAAIIAARANRTAGRLVRVTVAASVRQVINQFPAVFKEYLCAWSGVCLIKGGSYRE
jgi:NAD(P)H-hydrate repair Nnr-like enzyme with NAD(P)H-hydrate dehydratase domain